MEIARNVFGSGGKTRFPPATLILWLLGGATLCFSQIPTPSVEQSAKTPLPSEASIPTGQKVEFTTEQSATPPPVPPAGDPIYAPIATRDRPQTFRERWMDFATVTVGPRALVTPAVGSAVLMLVPTEGYPREWRQGMGAFGRIYGHQLASGAATQTARFLTAAALREDFRYRPSTSKKPVARVLHALAFTFVDKSDTGRNRLALSNFAAAAAGGFTPNLYMPQGYNTVSRAETRIAVTFGGFVLRNVMTEFAPELFKAARKLHLPSPRVLVPEWWTSRR